MAKKTRKFKTEVQQLLNLVIHSLYSKKEIFLRELISNASDAIDRARFEALTNDAVTAGEGEEWKIQLIPDEEARTLTIVDNGVGMTAEEVEANIGTIANSGTRRFLDALQESPDANPELIGQFGVGFYAAFMVADKVTLETRRAGTEDPAIRWISDGTGSYTLEEIDKPTRGTTITLHLREEAGAYLEEWQIRKIVKEYSDYISHPITMEITRTEPAEEGETEETTTTTEETLNSRVAIWRKSKTEISEEEYNEFYKHVSHDYSDPLRVIHFVAEGATEFRALLYLPSQLPFDFQWNEKQSGIHLYVRNVFITDDCKDLLPDYLRFAKGVVDSSDLPLNVSREMLQDDAVIRRIRKSLVGKILSNLKELKEQSPDDYKVFYGHFGKLLKEGVHSDFENREKLLELLLYPTSTSEGALVSLRDYADAMPEGQEQIYYLTAESLEIAQTSPHLEAFTEKNYSVLFLTDPIDEWVIQATPKYDDKELKAIDRGNLELDSEEEKKEKEEKLKESADTYAGLLDHIRDSREDLLKEVRLSSRLTESACCLVSDDIGMNANMERIMKAMNQDVPAWKRVLELNPDHPVMPKLQSLYDADKDSESLKDYIDLLLDQALLTEGSPISNPARFSKLVSKLMAEAN